MIITISEGIKIALISGCCSLLVGVLALIGIIYSTKAQVSKALAESERIKAQKDQMLVDRLDRIDQKFEDVDKKLDEHNGYAQKFSLVTNDITEIKTDIRWLREQNAKVRT